MAAVDDGDVDSCFTGKLGGAKLRDHSATAERALAVAFGFQFGSELADHALNLRLFAAVGNHESVNVGEQEKPVGFDGGRKKGTEFIVVTEGTFDLTNGDAVVFVDN